MKKRTKVYYVGFTDGKLFVDDFYDEYGKGIAADLFTTKAAAKRRFEDVRAMKLVPVRRSGDA